MPIIRSTGAASAARDLVDAPGLDPTYGMSVDELRRCGPPPREDEPADFDAFWQGIGDEARCIDPDFDLGPWRPWRYASGVPDGADHGGYEVADLTYTSLDGARIGGWVVRPVDGADQIAVCGHGYLGRSEPSCDDVAPTAISIYPVARGLPTRSSAPGMGREAGHHHVIWGIESPRDYAVVKSAVDYSIAATVGQWLLPDATRRVYHGGSFGGGVGTLMLSIDERFDAAVLGVPTFGNQPVRITQTCLGSGQIASEYVRAHPSALQTLRYADAASAARRVSIPVFVTPALADPVVPPPGQFAVAEGLAGPVWQHVLAGGHGSWNDFDPELRSANPGDWHLAMPTPADIDAFLREPVPFGS